MGHRVSDTFILPVSVLVLVLFICYHTYTISQMNVLNSSLGLLVHCTYDWLNVP